MESFLTTKHELSKYPHLRVFVSTFQRFVNIPLRDIHKRLLSGVSCIVPRPSAGRGASQCTHNPFTQAAAHTRLTTKTPHCPLSQVAQNQNGWLASPTMQAQR